MTISFEPLRLWQCSIACWKALLKSFPTRYGTNWLVPEIRLLKGGSQFDMSANLRRALIRRYTTYVKFTIQKVINWGTKRKNPSTKRKNVNGGRGGDISYVLDSIAAFCKALQYLIINLLLKTLTKTLVFTSIGS